MTHSQGSWAWLLGESCRKCEQSRKPGVAAQRGPARLPQEAQVVLPPQRCRRWVGSIIMAECRFQGGLRSHGFPQSYPNLPVYPILPLEARLALMTLTWSLLPQCPPFASLHPASLPWGHSGRFCPPSPLSPFSPMIFPFILRHKWD